ncbi:hypothetical protein BJ322DRAFT_1047938 [Thelephora terrestris]|uniref:Uncharacterized protein n=1 Tax=Thelephora terrestris TaxID=56493 RepID=A0A9P6HKV3_9AGAM|nr:hypothetical protein BJ322DRAFT_1047938 [Thelephora terrestris]
MAVVFTKALVGVVLPPFRMTLGFARKVFNAMRATNGDRMATRTSPTTAPLGAVGPPTASLSPSEVTWTSTLLVMERGPLRPG